ncbi:unnamed protein product, partial [Timema podura]|nr:unnamed protein product [Timema podura]
MGSSGSPRDWYRRLSSHSPETGRVTSSLLCSVVRHEGLNPLHFNRASSLIPTHDSDFMYLVKIAPRRDIFESLGSTNNLQPLWYFVRHHMTSRRKRIIPELERWIPNCGPRLIMRGINIFTEFGDLTPHEILLIFQDFLSWPEYPMCTFPASMETALLKMEPASDDFDKDMEDTSFDTHVNVDDLDDTYIRDDDDDHNVKSKGSESTFAWRESGKPFRNPPSSPNRDTNLILPVLGSQAQHKTSMLANYATEAELNIGGAQLYGVPLIRRFPIMDMLHYVRCLSRSYALKPKPGNCFQDATLH